MQETTNKHRKGSVLQAPLVYLLLSVAGLSFCFFLGFPFDNHNESYNWIPILNKVSFWDTLSSQVIKIESFRPLGMANAWLAYKLSGNIYLQQLLNWLFAIASFILLYRAVHNKILVALLSFVVGACFFSGYIYLFHLHGVFYGPFQLYTAILATIAWRHRRLSGNQLLLLSMLTLVICLYHTFALLIFCSFLAGYMLQHSKTDSKKDLLQLGIVLLLTILLGKMILQSKEFKGIQAMAEGLVVSYKMAELNKGLSIVALLLSLLSASTLSIKPAPQKILVAATALTGIIMIYLQLPVLVLWIAICMVQLLAARHMVMAALVAATAILPLGSGSGSPTYVIFVLMLCAFTTAAGQYSPVIPDLPVIRKLFAGSLVLLLLCLLALKAGKPVPLVAAIARPVLAEEEKTTQMQKIIEWKKGNQQYAALALRMYDASGLPVSAGNALSRVNRPVAGQDDVDVYVDYIMNDSTRNALKPAAAWVTFGDKLLPGKELIFSVEGKWNGKALVFK
jgi:hypothetical protein